MQMYICLQRHNFFSPIDGSTSARHDVGQGNINILQHLQSNLRSGTSNKLTLNQLVRFCLNNMANVHWLTSQSRTSCSTTWRLYRDHRFLWCHFTLSI